MSEPWYRDPCCPQCRQTTSGDCGWHGPQRSVPMRVVSETGLAPSRVTAVREVRRLLHGPGEVWECGVYRGETARLLRDTIGETRTLRLFDTFTECPEAGPEDTVRWPWRTSLAEVQQVVAGPDVHYHVGRIPATFAGLEHAAIAFVYLDVTLYQGTRDALAFVVPRLVPGGVVFVRDYFGAAQKGNTWTGLVRAVDESGYALERQDYDALIRQDAARRA